MAILKDLIVHGSSRFLNKIYASEIQTPLIEAEAGIIKKLKADDATVVGLLDVKGQLHTNSWSNSNIATIDGSFYITPTIGSTSGTVSITSSSLVFSGTNYAVSSLYLGDGSSITWPQYSKVLVTGQILSNGEWIPLGTLLGQLSSTATAASISINNIKDNKNQTSNVLATLVSNGTTSSNYRNLKVSLYQRATSSTDFRPLGIYMTATGTNGRTFLDIYGGVESLSINNNYGGFAEPNVRIGNLQGLPNVGGQTPSGWGIYTDNGYFKGIIAADQGYIGSGSKYWVIANEEDLSNSENSRSYIYNGTNNIASTVEGIYLGTDGIRNYKDSTHFVTIQNGVVHAKGVNLTGQIIATSGTIGGWNIGTDTNKSLYYGNQTPGATTTNLVLSPTSATNSNAIGGSSTGLTWFISAGKVFGVTTAGALYATSGKIGGWTIGASSLYNSKNSYNNSNEGLYLGTDYIAGGAGEEWWFKKDGSAKIGAMTLSAAGVLSVPAANISGTLTANQVDVSSINIGDLSGVNNYAQKTDVTNAIDNLQIGGRNLILDTATSHSSRTDDTQYIANYIMSDYGKSLMNNTEDYFTLSFDYEIQGDYSTASSDSRIYAMINGTAASPSKPIYVKNASSTGHYSTTCKMTQAQVDSAAGTCRARWNGIVEGCTFTIKNYKVEKGTKETSWTPAPEDVDETINNIEIGGRNLIRNTTIMPTTIINGYNFRASGGTVSHVDISSSPINGITGAIRITNNGSSAARIGMAQDSLKNCFIAGEKYTMSCWVRASVASEVIFQIIWASDERTTRSSSTILGYNFNVGTDWTYLKWEGATLLGTQVSQYSSGYVYGLNIPVNGWIEVCGLKVEKGNKATAWTPAPEDIQSGIDYVQNTANVALSQSVEYIIGTQTAVTGSWTGISNTISELKDGTQIRYWLPHAGSGNATLNLTLANGTTTGAIPIYRQGGYVSNGNVVANRVTTHFPTGSVVSMTYGVDRSISVVSSGATYTGLFTGWFADGAYDSGNTVNRVRLQNVITAETAITTARIICGTANGYKNIGANISFDLSYPLLYAMAAITASKTGDNNYLSINGIYANNNGTIQSGAAKKTLYLKGNVTGNTFKISASPFMTTVQPTTNDGYYYIPLGIMYSTTAIYFQSSNRLYAYIDGAFQPVDTAAVLRAEQAKKVATNYITQIDNTGIKITPYDQSGNNYLQINSDAINMYRNNIETLRIGDSAIRIGKGGKGQKNVYIDNDSIDIRDNENILASFTGEDIKFYDGQIKGLEIASFGGANGVRIGNEKEIHFVINNSAVKALNNNGTTIFSIGTTDTLIGNTVKVFSGEIVPNEGYSITLNTNQISLSANDEFYIERIILKLKVAASGFDEDGIICQNFQVNQTNQEITLLNHTTKGNPGNFTTISNFIVYLSTSSNVFKYGTASSLIYSLNGTFSYYNGSSSYIGQIRITYDGSNTLTFNSIINSSSFGDNKFTLVSDEESDSFYRYSDIMVKDKTSYAPALTFGTRLGTVGPLSTVIGEALYAPGGGQMTIGKFNYGQDTQTSTYSFIVGNGQDDTQRSNAFTIDQNGNVGIQGKIHNIIISGGIETKLPLFHFEDKTWTIGSIRANGAWYCEDNNPDISVVGYTPVAIAGYSVWGGTNGSWCVVPRVYIDQHGTDTWGNPTSARLQGYVWNQGSQAATNVKFTVEILYIANNFID